MFLHCREKLDIFFYEITFEDVNELTSIIGSKVVLPHCIVSLVADGSCESNVPSIAQLVERRTVETLIDILRSLVRIRLEGDFFCFLCYFCNVCVADWILLSFILVWRRTSL